MRCHTSFVFLVVSSAVCSLNLSVQLSLCTSYPWRVCAEDNVFWVGRRVIRPRRPEVTAYGDCISSRAEILRQTMDGSLLRNDKARGMRRQIKVHRCTQIYRPLFPRVYGSKIIVYFRLIIELPVTDMEYLAWTWQRKKTEQPHNAIVRCPCDNYVETYASVNWSFVVSKAETLSGRLYKSSQVYLYGKNDAVRHGNKVKKNLL